MRKASIVLTIAACASSPLSLAQHSDPASAVATPAVATASAPADDDGGEHQKSGFGQVMSVLTGLLQDAAGKEKSAGASSSMAQTLSSEESAVTITVTPVAGRSTFYVDKPRHGPANATSSTQAVVATTDAAAADAASVAMQAEGALPD